MIERVKFLSHITMLLLGLLLGLLFSGNTLSINIDGTAALKTAENDAQVKRFIQKTSNDSEDMAKLVSLIWEPEKNIYYWKIILIERECGCSGPDRVDIAEVIVSPFSDSILSRQFKYGVDEDMYSKEQCKKACHDDQQQVHSCYLICLIPNH